MATPGPPRAEKLIFSDKTLACSNDSSPILTHLGGELVAGSGSFEALSHVQRVHLGKDVKNVL